MTSVAIVGGYRIEFFTHLSLTDRKFIIELIINSLGRIRDKVDIIDIPYLRTVDCIIFKQ